MLDAIGVAIANARKGKGATLIEAVSYRLSDHTTADDATRYRSDDELDTAWEYEPIQRLKTFLEAQGWWQNSDEVALVGESKQLVEEAVARYLNTPPQAPETAFDYLYEQPTKELRPQRDELINKSMRMQGGQHG
ncbi:branched-chain alpha-keto acid dehydrogenase [Vibrio maritimus]|uniref:2-oxoisovalerate dehydrogenase subunit alpha n=1 Tax=Vibrio maritimus TaxID=990268 RepID=A0A090T3D9_9VIBR|nr:branched-chain alpha-keto acid dehydrogenase [Vibrio maritimus]